MGEPGGRVLVVDDNIINRKQLARLLTGQGYNVTLAEDGSRAVALLAGDTAAPPEPALAGDSNVSPSRAPSPSAGAAFDVILLDILMPGIDGYGVLAYVKGQYHLRHIPVIMISALDEMDSVVRCIELGAADYLPKPFKPALLQARLRACLAEKRLRDLELEYLEQAGRVADAAQDVELGRFDPATLESVAGRDDALGRLARVFQRMAKEVYLREQRLQRQLEQLRLDMNEMRRGRVELARAWLPMDRQHALVQGVPLPDRTQGAALFADVSGFTPLTQAFREELGPRRGAEELTRAINQVYNGLIGALHRYGGSVIGFAGDSITCWIDDDDGRRGMACALAMQEAMGLNAFISTPGGAAFPLTVKIAVVAGPVRRFLVGDPQQLLVEVIAGHTVDRLAAAERCASRGDTIAGVEIINRIGTGISLAGWRTSESTGEQFALVGGLTDAVAPAPWPSLGADALPDQVCRPWLLPPVFERLHSGAPEYLADLRPVTALFLSFSGIDYDADEDAGSKLDSYIRWVQAVGTDHGGWLHNVTIGDKGCYLLVVFGAPVSHENNESRAVRCALQLLLPPHELEFIKPPRVGIASELAWAGAYGSETRRGYGILGDRINLAARLMQAAPAGNIFCDRSIVAAASPELLFEKLQAITVKGRSGPAEVYRPVARETKSLLQGEGGVSSSNWAGPAKDPYDAPGVHAARADAARAPGSVPVEGVAPGRDSASWSELLSPSEMLVLKVASVLGEHFSFDLLKAVFPVDSEKGVLAERLTRLEQLGLVRKSWPDESYGFQTVGVQEAAYNGMLFAQRRMLHRQVAEWCESNYSARLEPYYAELARHWEAGEEPAKAIDYLEKAANRAQAIGDLAVAEALLERSVRLEEYTAVLSAGYYGDASQTGTAVSAQDWDGAMRYALSRLEHELSPELRYHSLWHTQEDVLPAARRLAHLCRLSDEETRLVEIGAVYHDLGFLVDRAEHERAGAKIAAQVLPGFGFGSEQVAAVQGMILATRIPQSPRTRLEEIVADADLDNLGRGDCLARTDALRAEQAHFGRSYNEEEWLTHLLKFMLNHSYWSEPARNLRNEAKRENIAVLEARLAALHADAV